MTSSDSPASDARPPDIGAQAGRGLAASALVTMGALTMLGPYSTDAFLPALPQISVEFAVSGGSAQLALTGITIGMAVGQLFAGPLSDGWGRRGPLLAGSAAMALASVGAALADSMLALVIWCSAIGLSASFGGVVSRAVVSDSVTGPRLVSAYAVLGTLVGIGPVISPTIGVVLMTVWGWRGIFVALAVMAAACLVALVFAVPESLPAPRRVQHPLRSLPRNTVVAVRKPTYLSGAGHMCFGFAVMFAYIAGSSFLVQSVLGLSAAVYAVMFGLNGVGLILAGIITARLSRRRKAHDIIAIGLTMQATAAVLVLTTALTGTVSAWTLFPALTLIAASMGFVFGPSTSIALHGLQHVAGTALAVAGTVQFVFAGIVAPLVAIGGERNPVPFAVIVAIGTALGWACWAAFRPAARSAGLAR
ncbi:MAG: multidrug effflux MFS transporter [Microbacterium sp.]